MNQKKTEQIHCHHQQQPERINPQRVKPVDQQADRKAQEHADHSAHLANATQPEFLSTLVVSFPQGEARFRAGFPGWEPLGQHGLFVEMERFLSQLELNRSVFRSDHASNILVLKGTLGADKARLLEQVRQAIATPEAAPLRPAWARGL